MNSLCQLCFIASWAAPGAAHGCKYSTCVVPSRKAALCFSSGPVACSSGGRRTRLSSFLKWPETWWQGFTNGFKTPLLPMVSQCLSATAGVPGSPDQTGRPPGAEGPLLQVRGSAAAPRGDTGSWWAGPGRPAPRSALLGLNCPV